MRKSRFTEGQIVAVLKEHEAGAAMTALCRRHGSSEQSRYRWKRKDGGLAAGDAGRLKALAEGDARLRRMGAGHTDC